MKQSLYYVLGCVMLLFSCTNDTEIQDVDTIAPDSAELSVDLSVYADSPLGLYKGVFTTNDSEERGVVEIQVINEELAKARIEMVNGDIVSYSGRVNPASFSDRGGITATFRAADGEGSFVFSVNADGSNPATRSVVHTGKPSFISLLKEDSRLALITSTGLYSGSGFNGTWNLVFDSQADANANSANFTSQILVNGTDIGTDTGNGQTTCSDDGTTRMCAIDGVADTASGITLNWTGTHISTIAAACSQINGTWSAMGPDMTMFTGTFTSDVQCTPPANDQCGGAIEIFCDDNFSSSTATATTTGEPATFCGTSNPNGGGVWYEYNGTAAGNIITVSLAGSNYDTKLFLYSGDCMTLTCLAGNDDGGPGLTSELTFTEVDGTTYYLYAAGFNGASGTLNVSVTCVPPPPTVPNDLIGGAIPITPSAEGTGCTGATFTLDFMTNPTEFTTDSGLDASCNPGTTGLDRFFSWTATSERLLFSSQAPGNPGIAIRQTDGTEIACLGTFGDGLLSGWMIGDDLIIQIYDFDGANSDVGFCLEENTPPPPPMGCGGTVTDFAGTIGGIPDSTCPTDTDFIAASTATGTIGIDADIDNVTLDITHTFDADLDIALVSPAGTELSLSAGNGGSGDNYTMTVFQDGGANITTTGSAPFTDIFQAEGGTFAATFDGESVNGNWLLRICDSAGGDVGALNDWSIGICDENIPFAPSGNDEATRFNTNKMTKQKYRRLEGLDEYGNKIEIKKK